MANLTRRNFIGVGVAGALGAAGLGLAGCAPQKEAEKSLSSTGPDNLVWDEEYDVVVAGFGGAGGAAAIEAFDNGASVLVLDSDAMPGGATSINGGVIQCAGSSVQKAAGIEDNVDDWFDYIKAMEGPSFHEELIRPMTLEDARERRLAHRPGRGDSRRNSPLCDAQYSRKRLVLQRWHPGLLPRPAAYTSRPRTGRTRGRVPQSLHQWRRGTRHRDPQGDARDRSRAG